MSTNWWLTADRFSESKTTNDFFKTELNYDAVADPANFVKDIFREEETISEVPEKDCHLTDIVKQENKNDDNVTSDKIFAEPSDKPQGGDVRIFWLTPYTDGKFELEHFLLSKVKRKANLQCSECEEIFNKKIDLKRHLSVDHVENDGEK